MKYAVSVQALAEHGELHPHVIELFSEAGFECVSVDPRTILDLAPTPRKLLIDAIKKCDMDVALHGSFDVTIKDLKILAKLFGPRLLNVTFDPLLGWTSAGMLYNAERMCAYLAELDPIAKDCGFFYGVEDFPETPFAMKMYRDHLAPLLDSGRFGILIDIGHFNESKHKFGYFKGVSPEEHLAQLPLPLLELHLSDNNGMEDQHLPLGRGNIDFESLARGLKQIGFDGLVTIEIDLPRRGGVPVDEARNDIIESLLYWKSLEEADDSPARDRM